MRWRVPETDRADNGPGYERLSGGCACEGDARLSTSRAQCYNLGTSARCVFRTNHGQQVSQLQISGRGTFVAVTTLVLWAASLAVILAGGYTVAVGTPCLCADVNGLLLGGGLVIILIGAAMLLWSRELARFVIDKLTGLLAQGK